MTLVPTLFMIQSHPAIKEVLIQLYILWARAGCRGAWDLTWEGDVMASSEIRSKIDGTKTVCRLT